MKTDILKYIEDNYSGFSKGQKQIASFITNHFDKAAYMTAARLGQEVGVSESTVVRFATELGFAGYPQFQKALQELIRSKLTIVQRLDVTRARMQDDEVLKQVALSDINNIRRTIEDLNDAVFYGAVDAIVNAASRYSPWNARTFAQGYLTAPGGHRIGLCGMGAGETLREYTSLCIRIARDHMGIAAGLPMEGNLLILGAPGTGKTTLLRDYIRQRARRSVVAVVDERREIFPEGFDRSGNLDVLSGVAKGRGMDMVLRSMSPQVIALDEITCAEDCAALIRAAWCGVHLVATAHAGSLQDLRERQVYRPLLDTMLFSQVAVLDNHQSWHIREVTPCCD